MLNATEGEKVIVGEKLSDIHVNLAQRLLRAEFPNPNGLLSTFYKEKKQLLLKKENKLLQIIQSTSRHH